MQVNHKDIVEMLEGHVSVEKTPDYIQPWRLPYDKLPLFAGEKLLVRGGQLSGVRLRFKTDASRIKMVVEPEDKEKIFDLTIDGNIMQTFTLASGSQDIEFTGIRPGQKILEIWLHQASPLKIKRLESDGTVEPVEDRRLKWTTYGSSITHCILAKSPCLTWPSAVSRSKQWNLTCLGYGASCLLEPMAAVMVRDIPSDFISLKMGINVYSANALSPRTFKSAVLSFIYIIREKQPDVPIAAISPIVSVPHEDGPNAVGMTLKMMREDIRDAVERFKSMGDKHIAYFSGLELLNESHVEKYLADAVHPNAAGYELLGKNFIRTVADKYPW